MTSQPEGHASASFRSRGVAIEFWSAQTDALNTGLVVVLGAVVVVAVVVVVDARVVAVAVVVPTLGAVEGARGGVLGLSVPSVVTIGRQVPHMMGHAIRTMADRMGSVHPACA